MYLESLEQLKELIESSFHHISYSETEAARRLDLSVKTMRNLRNKGQISFSCVASRIRYTPEQLDTFLKKHEIKAR